LRRCLAWQSNRPFLWIAEHRNLRRGRALITIVGDGIRREAEVLLGDLHRYAHFEFTLALIELAVFKMPEPNRLLIRPRTFVKTEMVRRVVFSVAPKGSAAEQDKSLSDKVETLSSEAYWSALQSSVPNSRPAVERFIEAVEAFGVYPEFLSSLIFKWARPAGGTPVNLGMITKTGVLWTDAAAWWVPKDLARQYVEVAAAFGCDVHQMPKGDAWSVYRDGRPLRLNDVLDRLQAWVPAMQNFIATVIRHDASVG
jgi:hypothetical protein